VRCWAVPFPKWVTSCGAWNIAARIHSFGGRLRSGSIARNSLNQDGSNEEVSLKTCRHFEKGNQVKLAKRFKTKY